MHLAKNRPSRPTLSFRGIVVTFCRGSSIRFEASEARHQFLAASGWFFLLLFFIFFDESFQAFFLSVTKFQSNLSYCHRGNIDKWITTGSCCLCASTQCPRHNASL